MKVQQLKKVLKASYRSGKQKIDNYDINPKLSGTRVQVYYDPSTKKAIVAHRGTKKTSIHDIGTDIKMLFGFESGNRFKHAKKIQRKAENLYGRENITTVGHSLGGRIAEKVGKKSAKIVTYNKAATPKSILQKTPPKQTDIVAKGDVVSILTKLQKHSNPVVVAPGSYNLLKTHSMSKLKYIKDKNI